MSIVTLVHEILQVDVGDGSILVGQVGIILGDRLDDGQLILSILGVTSVLVNRVEHLIEVVLHVLLQKVDLLFDNVKLP